MAVNENQSKFFARNDYFIDEKVAFLKFTNSYKIYDSGGSEIGSVQQSRSALHKMLSLLINSSFFPLKLDIKDMDENILVTIKRGWTFFMSKIEVLDGEGSLIAVIQQKFQLLKPRFTILDPDGKELGVISGDWTAWNFAITDSEEKRIGAITKKWNGALKEFFTTADKYIVSIDPALDIARKIPILASAITIDMVLKETK